MQHYDMDGLPISLEEWLAKFTKEDRRICFDELYDPATQKTFCISTVFIGFESTMFETALWGTDMTIDVVNKYPTMGAAWGGHLTYCLKFRTQYPVLVNTHRHSKIAGTPEKPDFTVDT